MFLHSYFYFFNYFSVDTYESHESVLYCKAHFKLLFSPKAVEDSEPGNKTNIYIMSISQNVIQQLFVMTKMQMLCNFVQYFWTIRNSNISIILFVEPPRKPELIIRENQPDELPPDVVRSSDKSDLGLDELHQLNVKSRYQVFEQQSQDTEHYEKVQQDRTSKRSATILSKLAK